MGKRKEKEEEEEREEEEFYGPHDHGKGGGERRKSGVVSTVLQIDKKVEMISTIGILPRGRWIDSSKMKMEVFSTKEDG